MKLFFFILHLLVPMSWSLTTPIQFRQIHRPHTNSMSGLFGDVEKMGYFYAPITLGTQEFGVIIDTGSHRTIVPCDTCNRCGHHLHQKYHPHQKKMCGRSACRFSISYLEGSSLKGFEVLDDLKMGGQVIHSNYEFGCAQTMTNLFRSQLADGIMGLNKQGLRHITPNNQNVAILLREKKLIIGENIHYQFKTPVTHQDNYYTSLQKVSYGQHSFQTHENILFDTGSTYSYVTSSFFNQFKRMVEKECSCHLKKYRDTLCFPPKTKSTNIHFYFQNQPMIIEPSAYTYPANGLKCIELVQDRAPITIGMNFLRSLQISFFPHQIEWDNLSK